MTDDKTEAKPSRRSEDQPEKLDVKEFARRSHASSPKAMKRLADYDAGIEEKSEPAEKGGNDGG